MHTYSKRFLKYFDFPLFFTYLFLCLFGLVMIYSASLVYAVGEYKWAPDHFYRRQIFNLVIAFSAFFMAAFFPYKNYKRKSLMVFLVSIMLLLLGAVHFFGYGDDVGARSWIFLGFGSIQPSEVAKLIIIIYFSSVFAKKYEAGTIDNVNQSIGPPVTILAIAVGSVLMETDIGTSLIIIIVALSVMAASGIKAKTFLKLSALISGILLLIAPIVYLNWENIMTTSRKGRFLAYLNPFDYITGSGYQIANGYIAIGSGGVKGLGFGNSIQKMGYLPEPHTDVIMAVISEELGIVGAIIVIGGLGFIVLRALLLALKAKDPHARMLAAGVGSMIGIQTFVNLGGLTGLIPLTGVPLPFISFGGTSVILTSIAVGILMNVSMFVKYEKNK
ncbi:FtsW/RodA/SpoVE family cell cycle protein [Sporosarcina sp. Marseille-Q4063]|uniref:FtsW/RodA/SpoVE family cell cycle protein n=1 Tax=Sporosarcina sp. Marseille-Q4063 TaxID=2810514 RepID=UPI001BAFB0B2|nr:FtsW/RodA/SpoVE family cell cycle protein [Sporosarcina sp. Marseille-Q4063]QUW21760.1 FtsW/RodA/SpoVE family cell cycle protein [Sporosarcina sp. Marseille-Q4063]